MTNEQKEPMSVTGVYAGQLLKASDVAAILGVDDVTVRRWIKNGLLEAVTLPGMGKRRHYRIKGENLDNILSGGVKE